MKQYRPRHLIKKKSLGMHKKIIIYMYINYIYTAIQNLMVTTNQKYITDMQTKRKPNITLEIVIKSQQKRTREKKENKDLQKQIQNN